jgi:hypothetical protein
MLLPATAYCCCSRRPPLLLTCCYSHGTVWRYSWPPLPLLLPLLLEPATATAGQVLLQPGRQLSHTIPTCSLTLLLLLHRPLLLLLLLRPAL